MAIFKPEVRTVEGSNVGTYNPPTVDYSGIYSNIGQSIGTSIGSIFDSSSRKGNVSEGDKETLALQDVASQYERAKEIEDPVVRAVKFKGIYINSLKEHTKYDEGMKELYATISGETYQGSGVDPNQIVQANTYAWATSTDEGKSSAAVAQLRSGGDPILMDQYIKDAYLVDLAYKNKVASAEQEAKLIEADANKRKIIFSTTMRPILQERVNKYYARDTDPAVIRKLFQEAKAKGIDETTYLIDSLTMAKNQVLADITSDINRDGIDPTTVNPESFVANYDARIKAYTQNQDLITRSFKSKTDKEKIEVIQKSTTDPFLAEAAFSNNPIFFQQRLVNNPALEKEIYEMGKAGVGSAGADPAPDIAGPPSSRRIIADSESEFADKNLGVASREILMKTFSAPKPAQIALGKLGKDALLNYKYNPDVPENTDVAYRNIAGMYVAALPDIDKERSGIKFANMQKLIGDKAFETVEAIKSTNPNYGNALYNQMNAYSLGAVESLTDAFVSNMVTIRDTDYNPFVLEMDKNNNIRLNINKDALVIDNNLKKAMGMYRYQTVPAGKTAGVRAVEVAPTETDPMKILSNYVSLLEGTNQKEIIDIVESLKLIAKQSSKIPAGFRTERDPLQIIKQNVTVLEK